MKVTQTLCTKADEWMGPFEKPRLDGLCRPSANRAERVEMPAQKEQVLYIQRRLQAGGHKIKADGKFGKESRRLARDYLAKAGQSVADDAATEDYYRAFLQLEEAGY